MIINSASAGSEDDGITLVSDDDRDRALARLQAAFAEGRLQMSDLDGRVARACSAKTAADLAAALGGLPEELASHPAPMNAAGLAMLGGTPGQRRHVIATFGSVRHGGRWVVPPRFTAVSVLGGVEIDLRESSFAERETVVRVYSVLGYIKILVPDGVEVRVDGKAVVGEFGRGLNRGIPPEAPESGLLVRVGGLCVGGYLAVEVSQPPGPVPAKRRRRFPSRIRIRIR